MRVKINHNNLKPKDMASNIIVGVGMVVVGLALGKAGETLVRRGFEKLSH